MRKIIPLMLAVALILSMNAHSVVLATEGDVYDSASVKAGFVPAEEGGQVISVDIKWSGMEFTYNEGSEPIWDAEKHQYSDKIDAAWSESNAYISITNHSNVILQSRFKYVQNDGFEAMNLKFADGEPYIGSAYTGEETGEACSVVIRVIPTGTLPNNTAAGTDVGEIEVRLFSVDNPMEPLSAIYGLYDTVLINDGSTSMARGDLYYTSATIKTQVENSCTELVSVLNGTDPDYVKNDALNELITTYYNNLYLMQK